MSNPGKERCAALPKEAFHFLKRQANQDLLNIQELTNKIHNYFEKLSKNQIKREVFNKEVQQWLRKTYEHIQDLSNLNSCFPTLFTDDQVTVLLDLMQLTTALNLQFPNPEVYTEYANGQIGGAATIMQQQWAA